MCFFQRNVPVEHIGIARAYVRQFDKFGDKQFLVLANLLVQIADRLRKKPNIRPDHFVDVERVWRNTVPKSAQLSFDSHYSKRGFLIEHYFLTPAVQTITNMDDTELAVGVYKAVVSSDMAKTELRLVATISLHALARWLQRNTCKTFAAFQSDVLALTSEDHHQNTHVRTPDGAYWMGRPHADETVRPIDGTCFPKVVGSKEVVGSFNVRTFFSAPMIGLRSMEGDD